MWFIFPLFSALSFIYSLLYVDNPGVVFSCICWKNAIHSVVSEWVSSLFLVWHSRRMIIDIDMTFPISVYLSEIHILFLVYHYLFHWHWARCLCIDVHACFLLCIVDVILFDMSVCSLICLPCLFFSLCFLFVDIGYECNYWAYFVLSLPQQEPFFLMLMDFYICMSEWVFVYLFV